MPKPAPAASSAVEDDASAPSYEAALQELEQLVARLESGAMPLADLMRGYERGAELLAVCRRQLGAVEDQVKVLEAGMQKSWTPD